jgi:hypothetical protein
MRRSVNADNGSGEDRGMEDVDAAARAAGTEVSAHCSIVFGDDALVELPDFKEPVRWPAADVAAELGVTVAELSGMRFRVTYRETPEEGPVLWGFRLTGER